MSFKRVFHYHSSPRKVFIMINPVSFIKIGIQENGYIIMLRLLNHGVDVNQFYRGKTCIIVSREFSSYKNFGSKTNKTGG